MNSTQSRIEDVAPQSLPEATAEDHWNALIGAQNAEQLCAAWLPILCTMVPSARCGLLLLQDTDGSFVPAAVWPKEADLGHLRDIAEDTITSRRGAIRREAPGSARIAYPLEGGDALFGAVILDLATDDDAAMQQAMRLLHWGAGWLLDLNRRRALQQFGSRLEHSAYLLDLVLSVLAETEFRKTAFAVVNRLAQRFDCHQVQLGIEKGKTVRVEAVSQSAWFDEKANLINLAAQAMNEAFDQRSTVVLPEVAGSGSLITTAHRRYADESGCAALCSMPLVAGNKVVAVWLLERDRPFSAEELETLDALALALAPIVELKQAGNESLPAHARRSFEYGLQRITDTSHPGLKLLAVAAAVLLAMLAVIDVSHRVAAPAVIEGATLRAAVAPFEGYIRSAPARAGDVVQAGQLLATLDDKDLLLEQARWQAEHEMSQRKALEARAKEDRVELRLASAQADQALAQLNLVQEKLARARVTAPFDGIVVRGDLSQQIGSPVEKGKVLFEVSPLVAWRVILKVDERDIAHIRDGMSGELLLTSLPAESYAVVVRKVTPVATAEEGRNYFRVEATLADTAVALRPNMEGVAKIVAGDRSVLWIWTHRLTDWLRVMLWKLLP